MISPCWPSEGFPELELSSALLRIWNDGLRLVEPTPRREQWNDGIMGSGLRLGENIENIGMVGLENQNEYNILI